MLSPFGKPHTTIIMAAGLVGVAAAVGFQAWITGGAVILGTVLLLAFFRDPNRQVPTTKGHVVSPADGRISSIHTVDHFEPFDGPAVCVRVFLSVLDVHVNRSPIHGRVASITHKPGQHLNALKAESAEFNESVLMVMTDPVHRDRPVCAVKQIAGAIARRIVCGAIVGDILQRGQRYGMIKFGSTTELYLPSPDRVSLQVTQGRYVYGGSTVMAIVAPPIEPGDAETVGKPPRAATPTPPSSNEALPSRSASNPSDPAA